MTVRVRGGRGEEGELRGERRREAGAEVRYSHSQGRGGNISYQGENNVSEQRDDKPLFSTNVGKYQRWYHVTGTNYLMLFANVTIPSYGAMSRGWPFSLWEGQQRYW